MRWRRGDVIEWLDSREGRRWLDSRHRPIYTPGGQPLTFATIKEDDGEFLDMSAAYHPNWTAGRIMIFTDPCLRVVEVDESITDLPSPA